jgi:predicted ATPase
LALNLVSMFNTKSLIGRILYVVAAWLSDNKYQAREIMPRFWESYQSALKNGDFEVVGYCEKHKSQYSYFVGQELTDL